MPSEKSLILVDTPILLLKIEPHEVRLVVGRLAKDHAGDNVCCEAILPSVAVNLLLMIIQGFCRFVLRSMDFALYESGSILSDHEDFNGRSPGVGISIPIFQTECPR